MNKFKIAVVLGLLLMGVLPGFAQQTTTATVLSAAIDGVASTTTLTLASTTGITGSSASTNATPASGLYIDQEYMNVRTVVSTTVVIVLRGQGGSGAAPHNANAVVWIGPQGASGPFRTGDGSPNQPAPGQCTRASILWLPMINIRTGNIWDCPTVSNSTQVTNTAGTSGSVNYWQSVNLTNQMGGMPYKSVVNAAYSATLYDVFIDYVSATTTRILTLPAVTGIFGKIIIVHNASGNGTNPNGAVTVTGNVGQFVGTSNATTSSVTGGGGVLRLISVGLGWATW